VPFSLKSSLEICSDKVTLGVTPIACSAFLTLALAHSGIKFSIKLSAFTKSGIFSIFPNLVNASKVGSAICFSAIFLPSAR
jgi:hypothetical protein